MIAMLIGTIALMGSIAIQQAIVNGAKSSHDASVAQRLASQKSEELSSRPTDTFTVEVEYVNAMGKVFSGVPTDTNATNYRWRRQWKVANLGVGMPYNITVVVVWMNDSGDGKTIRLDVERRKAW